MSQHKACTSASTVRKADLHIRKKAEWWSGRESGYNQMPGLTCRNYSLCKTHHSLCLCYNLPLSIFPQLPIPSSTRSSLLRSAWQPSPPMTSRRPLPSLTRTRVASLRRMSWSRHPLLNFTHKLLKALVALGSSFSGSQWNQNDVRGPKASEKLRLLGVLLDCNSIPVLSFSASRCRVT